MRIFLVAIIIWAFLGFVMIIDKHINPPEQYVTDNMMDARKFSRACKGNVKISQKDNTLIMECIK